MESGTDLLEKALQIARERGYAEVSLETDDLTFSATLAASKKKPPAFAATGDADVNSAQDEVVTIKSSLVGYFQLPPKGLKPGAKVEPETVLAIITVFGINNEVEADCHATVKEIFVSEGAPVEYGQPLMSLQVEKS